MSTYTYGGVKRKHRNNDSDSEDGDGFMELLKKFKPGSGSGGHGNGLSLFGNNDDSVFKKDNHLYFYDDVTSETCLRFTTLLREIDQEQQVKVAKGDIEQGTIHIHINSYGGSLLDGFSMASSVMACRSRTIGYVEGVCASAVTLPLVCCDLRKMQRFCYFLMHQLSSAHWGTHESFRDEMTNQEEFMRQIKAIYEAHTTIKPEKLDKILTRDLFWNLKKCKKYGIIDEVC
jgi:ATP-dependent protease ClpP protease subunit